VLEADGAYITLWDKARQMTIPTAASGRLRKSYPATQRGSNEQTLTDSVLTAGRPLAIDDVFNSHYLSHSIAMRFPARSILALPLIANEEKLGAALIAFDQPHHFTPDEIAIGSQIGPQIALAIYKALLLEDSYRRIAQLALLDEVSKNVADSLDEQEILQRTVEVVVNRLGYAEAVISLAVGPDELEVTAVSGTEEFGVRPGHRQKIGAGIIGHTAKIRQAYFTSDLEHDPYYISTGKRSGSAMGVPMLDKGQLLGVLYVESTRKETIKQADSQTLQTLISHVVTAVQKARLFTRAQEQLRAITALQSISQTISSSLELQKIFQTVVQLLKDTFDYTHVSIYLLDGHTLRLGAEVGYPAELIYYEIPVTSGVTGRTVLSRETQFIQDVSRDPDFLRAAHEVESEICVPLLKDGCALGVINVEAAPSHPLSVNDADLIAALAGPVAIAIDNARLHAEVKSLALTDGLTNLLNRRAFDQTLATEITRAGRYGHPLALIILDLDNFKTYNDLWGHPAGDERLIELAKLLQRNARGPDLAARYGGEEFALILPYTTKPGALSLAERIRKAAETQAEDLLQIDGVCPGYTISMGVAAYPEDGLLPAELLLAADNAALVAKRQGKNRVCAAGETA
jgi:diguanylate cyclase (GGDEF)-like protein